MVSKQEKLAEEIRSLQGQAPPVEVAGKTYIFKKLKRRDCQETLYDLIKPLIKIVSKVLESAGLDVSDLSKLDDVGLSRQSIEIVSDVIDAVPYAKLHAIAKKLLKDVIIDNSFAPDDFENPDADEVGYYDDKQLELIQALMKGIQVNYPFLGDLMKKKKKAKGDSDQLKGKKKKTK